MDIYLIKKGSNDNLGSYHIINNEIEKITKNLSDINKYDLLTDDIKDIIDGASYYGLFNEKKVIIIDNVKYFAGKFNYEQEVNVLLEFLKNATDIIFILLCDDITKTKENTKNVISMGAKIIDVTNISMDDKVSFLNDYTKNNNLKLDDPLYLLNNCYENLDYAILEVDKLSNISEHITKSMIDEYSVSLIKNDNLLFDLGDAITEKKYDDVFKIFDELMANNIDLSIIIGSIANTFENIYMVKECVINGLSDDEIMKELGYNKIGRVYVMKKKGRFYSLEELKDIILKLSEVDKKIKTGYNPVYMVKDFLLSL